MVAGDVVNDVWAAGLTSFQPAISVEVAITSLTSWSDYFVVTDGVTNANIPNNTNSTENVNVKIMINNAHYIKSNTVNFAFYSGIQIK
jgi:hypothetical protein